MAVLYTILGGTGSLLGPIIGVVAIESISFILSDIEAVKSYWPTVLGVILLVIIIFKPDGLLGFVVSWRERIGTFGIIKSGESKVSESSQSKKSMEKDGSTRG